MKKVIIVSLTLVLLASAVFAGSFGGDAGASISLSKELKEGTDMDVGYGLFVDTIATIGKGGKVEFAVGSRTDVCFDSKDVGNFIVSGLITAGVNINISKTFSCYVMPGYGAYMFIGGEKKSNGAWNIQFNLLGVGIMSGVRFNIGESGFLVNLSGSFIYPIPGSNIKAEDNGAMLLGNVGLGVGFSF